MDLIVIILLSISLSMDAFSLSLAYGTLKLTKKTIFVTSLIVGIFHFFMPLTGMLFGNYLNELINFDTDIIVALVLMFVGINMIFDKKEEIKTNLNLLNIFLFAFAVSLDSLSLGIGLVALTTHTYIYPLFFAMSSFIFTLVGLLLGTKINDLIGTLSTKIGGITLVIIGITYLL